MRKLFRYRYANETSAGLLILTAGIYTALALFVILSELPHYMEVYNLNIWFRERVCLLGGSAVLFWLVMTAAILCSEPNRYRRVIMKNGECHEGEIVGFIIKRNIRHYRGKECLHKPKTYILCVKCRGEITMTSELRGNPERVLKSTKCSVYFYKGKKYVTNFEERLIQIGKGISFPHVKTEFSGYFTAPFL